MNKLRLVLAAPLLALGLLAGLAVQPAAAMPAVSTATLPGTTLIPVYDQYGGIAYYIVVRDYSQYPK